MMGKVSKGERNPNWRGGRTITPDGYVLLRLPDHLWKIKEFPA